MDECARLAKLPGALLTWYAHSARTLPWRSDPTPYKVLVSELMLQQTRVEAALPYFERFVAALPDFAALAAAPEERLMKLWQGLGYYSRARNLQKAARIVMEQYGGSLPADFDALRTLPGVGDYTAGAVASIAFGLPRAAVDGNVLRVLARLSCREDDALAPAVKKEAARLIEALMPQGREGDFTQALMELGAILCLPNGRPLCESCPVAALCLAREAGRQEELPVKKEKKPRRIEEKTVLLLCWKDRIALRQRLEQGLLAGLWEPPCAQGALTRAQVCELARGMGASVKGVLPLPAAKHVFTHVEWRMTGWRVELEAVEGMPGEWHWPNAAQRRAGYPVPSAYRTYLP